MSGGMRVKVAVIGGRLQGIEASYLAQREGWEVTLIDRDPRAPAIGMSDSFVAIDITSNSSKLTEAIKDVDLIIPALEDPHALHTIHEKAKRVGVVLAYDRNAYSISSSKLKSNALFRDLGIPTPKTWPECRLPIIVKPSSSSGSRGIRIVNRNEELHEIIDSSEYSSHETVIQEFIPGPVYSIEVFGNQNRFIAGQITKIEVDSTLDCKRVLAPAVISDELKRLLREYSLMMAQAISLKGIMDVEAILNNDKWKVIEIDARLPSQTPTTVYHSTGINYLRFLYDIFNKGILPDIPSEYHEDYVIFEHIIVTSGILNILGEHVLSDAGFLILKEDFFGADEAITDYNPGSENWVATLIIKERDEKKLREKHRAIIENIKQVLKTATFAI
jgi:pyrrolysine biosynthesis protein PylC